MSMIFAASTQHLSRVVKVHRVSKTLNNSVKHWTTSITFGVQHIDET